MSGKTQKMSKNYIERNPDLIYIGGSIDKGKLTITSEVGFPIFPSFHFIDRVVSDNGYTSMLYYRDKQGVLYNIYAKNISNCNKNCFSNEMIRYEPVCGTDYKTYRNECSLKEQICKTSGYTKKMNDGICNISRSNYSIYRYINPKGVEFVYEFPENKNENVKLYIRM